MSGMAPSPNDSQSRIACPPVLLLAFNRPNTTRVVLQVLRGVRPRQLFFAVDGPRGSVPGEVERVNEVRALSGEVDWECETKTLFRSSNKGCKLAVSEAVTWFFDQVDAGIIMEDDCVPEPSFFPFAAELLEKYANESQVFLVSGNNFQKTRLTEFSYYISRYAHIWGWASWRRAWQHYDHKMSAWPRLRDSGWLYDYLGEKRAVRYWTRIFDDTYLDRNSSWGYRWLFSCWSHNGLAIHPHVNLVSNIGFGRDATHTLSEDNPLAFMQTKAVAFPLKHPASITRNVTADAFTQKHVFGTPSLFHRVARKIVRFLR